MEISRLLGLPAHPLVVHSAVVLLPLAAILTIIVAIWPRSRKWWAPIAIAVAVRAAIATAIDPLSRSIPTSSGPAASVMAY